VGDRQTFKMAIDRPTPYTRVIDKRLRSPGRSRKLYEKLQAHSDEGNRQRLFISWHDDGELAARSLDHYSITRDGQTVGMERNGVVDDEMMEMRKVVKACAVGE